MKLNQKLLGPKYGKEFKDMRDVLLELETPTNYIIDTDFLFGEISLNKDEFDLTFDFTCESSLYEGSSDQNFMVVLDLEKDPELELDGQARTIANKIQK